MGADGRSAHSVQPNTAERLLAGFQRGYLREISVHTIANVLAGLAAGAPFCVGVVLWAHFGGLALQFLASISVPHVVVTLLLLLIILQQNRLLRRRNRTVRTLREDLRRVGQRFAQVELERNEAQARLAEVERPVRPVPIQRAVIGGWVKVGSVAFSVQRRLHNDTSERFESDGPFCAGCELRLWSDSRSRPSQYECIDEECSAPARLLSSGDIRKLRRRAEGYVEAACRRARRQRKQPDVKPDLKFGAHAMPGRQRDSA